MNKPVKPKYKRSDAELLEFFADQIDVLKLSCSRFDSGKLNDYRRIATCLRILFHNSRTSKALIDQAKLDGRNILTPSVSLREGNVLSECNLIMLRLFPKIGKAKWEAGLDRIPLAFVSKDTWWEQQVMTDQFHEPLTRKRLVTYIANQDGGAHVDPEIDESFNKMRQEGFAWGNKLEVSEHPEKYALRQIGHEVLKSYLPSYRRAKIDDKAEYAYGTAIFRNGRPENSNLKPYHLTEPLAECPCRSGLLYKDCHLAGAVQPLNFRHTDDAVTAPPGSAYMTFGFKDKANGQIIGPMRKN